MKSKIIILFLIILFFGAHKLNSAQSDREYIKVSNMQNVKTFKGFIKQRPLTKLCFQTEGKISFMPYSKGDYVRKGQVLARLDGVLYKIRRNKFNLNDSIDYNILIAPYDGYIEEIYKPLNTHIKPNEVVLSLYPTDKTEAETMVDAKYINKINLKKNAKIEYKNSLYEAKISNISKIDDEYILEFKLNDLYKDIKEGTCVNIELNLSP